MTSAASVLPVPDGPENMAIVAAGVPRAISQSTSTWRLWRWRSITSWTSVRRSGGRIRSSQVATGVTRVAIWSSRPWASQRTVVAGSAPNRGASSATCWTWVALSIIGRCSAPGPNTDASSSSEAVAGAAGRYFHGRRGNDFTGRSAGLLTAHGRCTESST